MGYDIMREDVPRFRQRRGDFVLAGPNNATIVMGRDRRSSVDSGYGDRPGSGAILLVVGRVAEDPSPEDDRASIYVSARCDPDDVFGLEAGDPASDVSAIVHRADSVRISARSDVKIVVGRAHLLMKTDGSVVVEGDIQLGAGASERLLKESFAQVYATHTHLDSTSAPTGIPVGPVPESVYTTKSRGR